MKIAFFTNCYLPYLSGVTLSIKTLRDELNLLGHETFVIGPRYPNHQETDPKIFRLLSLPAPYPGYRLVFPYSYSVFNRLKEEKIDLIHAHQPFGVGLAALGLARSMKVPLVYTLHTLFPRYVHHLPLIPDWLSKRAVSAYLSFFCGQTDTVIVPSEMVRRWLALGKIRAPITVLPTGIKVDLIKQKKALKNQRDEIRRKYAVPNEAKLLIYAGRISEEKNIPFLLKAFPAIRKEAPNTYLMLVGGGPKESDYQALAKTIDPQIFFVGQKEHGEVIDHYLAADLFVYASVTETQGLVLCEAKACGLPVVAVFGGGIADVVESGVDGYLVPQNQTVFVDHVLRLLKNDPLRKEMSRKAEEDLALRFSAPAVAKRVEALYTSLIAKRRKL